MRRRALPLILGVSAVAPPSLPPSTQVFEVAGFTSIFTVDVTRDEAVTGLG